MSLRRRSRGTHGAAESTNAREPLDLGVAFRLGAAPRPKWQAANAYELANLQCDPARARAAAKGLREPLLCRQHLALGWAKRIVRSKALFPRR